MSGAWRDHTDGFDYPEPPCTLIQSRKRKVFGRLFGRALGFILC